MTRLFRSKSCVLRRYPGGSMMFNVSPPTPSLYLPTGGKDQDEEGGKDDTEEDEDEDEEYPADRPVTTPFLSPEYRYNINYHKERVESEDDHHQPILDILVAVLKKSLVVTCSTNEEDEEEEESMDIGNPTDVHHVSHVTFDPFNGFLGLPLDLQPLLPPKVPSAG